MSSAEKVKECGICFIDLGPRMKFLKSSESAPLLFKYLIFILLKKVLI